VTFYMFLRMVHSKWYAMHVSEVNEPNAEYTSALLDILVCCLFVLAMLSTAEVIRSMITSTAQRRRLLSGSPTVPMSYDATRTFETELTYEDLLALSESIGRVRLGLSQEQIGVLPTYTYRSRVTESTTQDGESAETEVVFETICAICREELKTGDELLVLPCLCQFHKTCITTWLATKASCPLCRSVFA
jgi:Ring finger domain